MRRRVEEAFGKRKRVNIKCLSTLHVAPLKMPSNAIISRKFHGKRSWMHIEEMHQISKSNTLIVSTLLSITLLKQIFILWLFAQLHCLRLSHVFQTMCVPLIFDLIRFVFHMFLRETIEINTPKNKRKYYVHFTRGVGFPQKKEPEKNEPISCLWYSLMLWDCFLFRSFRFRKCIQRSLSLNLNTSLKEMFKNKQKQNIMSNRCRWSDIESSFLFHLMS